MDVSDSKDLEKAMAMSMAYQEMGFIGQYEIQELAWDIMKSAKEKQIRQDLDQQMARSTRKFYPIVLYVLMFLVQNILNPLNQDKKVLMQIAHTRALHEVCHR